MKLRIQRRSIWTIALVAATALVVALLILIGLGILVIPGVNSPPGTYTVTSIEWHVIEGTTSDGQGWFGPQYFNSTGPPYPAAVTAGGHFQVSVQFSNFDTSAHNITTVYTTPPFAVDGVTPSVPIRVPPATDSARITITVTAPDVSGGSGVLFLTVDAGG